MGTFGADVNGEVTSGMNHEGESTKAAPRDGTLRSSEEVGESRWSEGGVCSEATSVRSTREGRSLKDEAKPFCISRWEVWEAWLKVKSNGGAAGLDGQSIEEFERDLKKNLYRIWNRMSSGSYFPPPDGEDPESKWWRKNAGDSDGLRSNCSNGREESTGSSGGSTIPAGIVRVSPEEVGAGCGGTGPADVLGL